VHGGAVSIAAVKTSLMFEDNGIFLLTNNTQGAANDVISLDDNDDQILVQQADQSAGGLATGAFSVNANDLPVTFTELLPNSGVFANYDESDNANLDITANAARGTSATVDYNEVPQTVLVGFDFATIDIQALDDEWGSGEEIPVVLIDADANLNSHVDEDLDLFNPAVALIPSLRIGSPFTLLNGSSTTGGDDAAFIDSVQIESDILSTVLEGTGGAQILFNITPDVQSFSQRMIMDPLTSNLTLTGGVVDLDLRTSSTEMAALMIITERTVGDLKAVVIDPRDDNTAGTLNDPRFRGFSFFNYDIRSVANAIVVDSPVSQITQVHTYLIVHDTSADPTFTFEDLRDTGFNAGQDIPNVNLILMSRNGTLGPSLISLNATTPLGCAGCVPANDEGQFYDALYDSDCDNDGVTQANQAADCNGFTIVDNDGIGLLD